MNVSGPRFRKYSYHARLHVAASAGQFKAVQDLREIRALGNANRANGKTPDTALP